MKHLLNNLSNEEKNNIREQHIGGMNVMTENFKRLMGAKHGNAKPLINEQEDEDGIEVPREYHGDNSLSGKYKGYLKNGDKNEVSELLSNLPTDTQFLALIDCEYADFSDINLDDFNDLVFINLESTPNNLLKTNGHSFKHDDGSFYVTKNM